MPELTKKRPSARLALALSGVVVVSACGGGMPTPPNPAPKPDPFVDDTDPVRARVTTAKKPSAPLVVDWKPEHRLDLEVRSKRGPAVVRFDKDVFELIPECETQGRYAYVGVTPKLEVVSIRSRAELHTNLPAGAFSLAAKLENEGALRADIRMVGQRILDRPTVTRNELRGNCTRATHFVRSMTVGAFRFMSGTAAELGGDVDVMGAGFGGSSKGKHKTLQVDGDFKACGAADPDAPNAPAQCRAIIRIQIVPIGAAAQEAEQTPTCGDGMRWNGSGCVTETRLAHEAKQRAPAKENEVVGKRPGGFECKLDSPKDCLEQCKAGNVPSCVNLGLLSEAGVNGVQKSITNASKLYKIGCDRGNMKGCGYLANLHQLAKNYREAAELGIKACKGGFNGACTNLAILAFYGRGVTENRPLAFKMWARACKLRDWNACNNAGALLFNGLGVPQDQKLARALFAKACEAPGKEGCINLGETYELGMGGPKDVKKAVELYLSTCNMNQPLGCILTGLALEERVASPDAKKKAAALYEKACGMPGGGGCLTIEEMNKTFGGKWSADGIDRRSCEPEADKKALGCYNAGIAAERGITGRIDRNRARKFLELACRGGLKRACRAPKTFRPRPRPLPGPAADQGVFGMRTPRRAARHVFKIAQGGDWARFAQEAMASHDVFVRIARALEPKKDPEREWEKYKRSLRRGFEKITARGRAFVRIRRVEKLPDIKGIELVKVHIVYKDKNGREQNEDFTFAKIGGRLIATDLD